MQNNENKPTSHRVFFALWPDDEIRRQIHEQIVPLFDRTQGRKVPMHNWHITLAFLGNVSEETYVCIQQQADKVTGQSFQLTLDTIGHWSRPRVAWLGCREKPQEVDELFTNLNTQLAACGYKPDYKIFQPHMTLMRKVTRRPKVSEFKQITWPVNRFVLVESTLDNKGSIYQIVNSWDLSR